MACMLAESPCDPLHRRLRQLRCLRCRFDCYRVERTSSRAGVAPAEVQRLSRRTFSPTIPLKKSSKGILWHAVSALSGESRNTRQRFNPVILCALCGECFSFGMINSRTRFPKRQIISSLERSACLVGLAFPSPLLDWPSRQCLRMQRRVRLRRRSTSPPSRITRT
jgi:hypothetical protein